LHGGLFHKFPLVVEFLEIGGGGFVVLGAGSAAIDVE